MATQREVIAAFMKSLDKKDEWGEEALDRAVKAAAPKSTFGFFQNSEKSNIKSQFMNDLKTPLMLDSKADKVEYFLRVYCGIDFTTSDSGAITGSDAGNKQGRTDKDIIFESGSVNTSFKNDSFSVNSLNVVLSGGKSFSSLSDDEKFIWQGLYTWWIEGALNLIAESYDDNFSFLDKKSSATTNKLNVEFINDANAEKLLTEATYNSTTGQTTGLTLKINMSYYEGLGKNLELANSEFDRAIAHEMTHAVMMANLRYEPVYRNLPGFITEGLAELTIGITNSNADKIKALAADITKFEIGLDANDLARDESFMYEGGYIFFRYLARQLGDLTLSNNDKDTLLLTFYGNDTIDNSSGNVTINSGYGKDSIKSSGNKVSIDAGNSDDFISSSGDKNTILAGDGKDSIFLAENVKDNKIDCGAGNDYVSLFASNSNNTIDGGKGNDTIYSNGENTSINGGEGKNYIYLQLNANKNTIIGGKDSDAIYSGATDVLINAGAGANYINLYETAKNNTINSDTGRDTVYIYKNSNNHTINAGDGKNIVHSEGENIFITTGSGKDVVQLYAADSTAKNNTVKSGDGDDSIYSGGTNISVNAEAGNDYIHVYSFANNVTINPGKGNDTIESFCNSGFLYQYASGDGNDTIKGFSEKDTLNITSGTYSTVKNGNDVIVQVGSAKVTLDGAANLSTLNIGTFKESTIKTVTNSTSNPVTVDSSVKVIDASSRTTSVKIIANSLDNTIKGSRGKDKIYGGAGNDTILGGYGNDKIAGQAGNDTLTGGKGNDSLWGNAGNDIFVYATGDGRDVIADYALGDKISIRGDISNEKVNGSDVVFTIGTGSLTVKNGKGKTLSMVDGSGNNYSKIVDSTTLTVTNSTSNPVTVDSSVKVIDASSRTTSVKIIANSLNNTIKGSRGNDKIYGGAGNDTILGGYGNDKIAGQAGNDTLTGGKGNDSLWGNAGNDIFVYASGDGRDVIADYALGDKISIRGDISNEKVNGSDVVFTIGTGSLTVKNGKGKILSMVDGSGNNYSKIVDSTTLTVTNSTSNPVTVDSSVKVIDASSRTTSVKIIANSLNNTIKGSRGNDKIYGGAGNDTILGSYGNDKIAGQAGNDTLTGGKGNDSLWGNAGNDTFVYASGDGRDVIFGFENNDMLKITGTISNSYDSSKKEIYFDVGSTTKAITLRNFSATSFNINGTSYKISGSKLIKR